MIALLCLILITLGGLICGVSLPFAALSAYAIYGFGLTALGTAGMWFFTFVIVLRELKWSPFRRARNPIPGEKPSTSCE